MQISGNIGRLPDFAASAAPETAGAGQSVLPEQGTLVQAKVLSARDGKVNLKLEDGSILRASLDSGVSLTEGQTATLYVRENNGSQVVLQVVPEDTANPESALRAARLPVTDDTLTVARLLTAAGLAVSRENLDAVSALRSGTDGMTADEAVFLLANGAGGAGESDGLSRLAAGEIKIAAPLEAVLKTLAGVLTDAEADTAVRALSGGEATALLGENAASGEGRTVSAGTRETGTTVIRSAGRTDSAEAAGRQEGATRRSSPVPEQTAAPGGVRVSDGIGNAEETFAETGASARRIPVSAAAGEIPVPDASAGAFPEAEAAFRTAVGGNAAGVPVPGRNMTAADENGRQAETPAASQTNQARSAGGAEAPALPQPFAAGTEKPAQPDVSQAGAGAAVGGRTGAVQPPRSDKLLPLLFADGEAGVSGAEELKNAGEKLESRLSALADAVRGMPREETADTLRRLETVRSDAKTFSQVSQFTYLQIPVKMGQRYREAELYVFHRGGKNRKIDPSDVCLMLAIDTDHMSRVETLVRVRDVGVSVQFGLAGERQAELFREHMGELGKMLQQSGYRLSDARVRVLEKATPPAEAISALDEFFPQEQTVDMLI